MGLTGRWRRSRRRQVTSCRTGKRTAFASGSLQHSDLCFFFCGCGPFLDGWMEKSSTPWRDRSPVSRPEFAFNGLTAPHTTTINWQEEIDGARSANSAVYFQYSGKTQHLREKDAKRSSGRANEVNQVRRPGKRLLSNERSSKSLDASTKEAMYEISNYMGRCKGRTEQSVLIAQSSL